MQEIIWKVKPQVVLETGIARGGGLIFYASILEMLGAGGEAVGIEIALRKHNRSALQNHPLSKRIKVINGSSVDADVARRVHDHIEGRRAVVILDSNHTYEHVKAELNLYQDLVQKGSYLVVSDTFLEYFPKGYFRNRPWDKGNNPATAVDEFIRTNKRFTRDDEMAVKLGITACPTGYLKCVRS